MAEEEKIQQHAKKALRSLTNKKKKWKERIKDFLWEILIIIVAVNITLWFHNWSDKRHEQAQVKEFLIGIRENLMQDTAMLQEYGDYMKKNLLVYLDSVLYQINHNTIDVKYIDDNSFALSYNYYLSFDVSLFQSFSASGNLRLIKNQKLLSDITSLYSFYNSMQDLYGMLETKRIDNLEKYILSKIGVINSNYNCKLSTIINQTDVCFFLQHSDYSLKNHIRSFNNYIKTIVTTIHEIDKELKDNFDYDVSKQSSK